MSKGFTSQVMIFCFLSELFHLLGRSLSSKCIQPLSAFLRMCLSSEVVRVLENGLTLKPLAQNPPRCVVAFPNHC